MINLRFKNPYKITKEVPDEHFENEEEYYEFGNLRIYEFDYNSEVAPKGNILLI